MNRNITPGCHGDFDIICQHLKTGFKMADKADVIKHTNIIRNELYAK